jgi:type II secretion system (T2SS) protein M
MPLVLKQVQKLAETSNVRLDSFAPTTATPLSGYESVGISVSVGGRYAAVQKFLKRLRASAGSTSGRIHATGRLYDVDKVSLTPGGLAPNELTAAVNLSTFVYTGVPLPTPSTQTTTTSGTEDTA